MDPHVEKDEALLGRLLANPAEVERLSDDQQVSELLAEVGVRHAQLSTLHLSLLSRLIKVRRQPLQVGATSDNDRLLSVDEAAEILKVTPQWLYRHARRLPFARRLSRKALRFSEAGLRRWAASRRVA
jgi:predicted DNA-binding transcriptional regulator AlpA